ncbi:MAG: Fic family protein [Burkholderiales bacterium]
MASIGYAQLIERLGLAVKPLLRSASVSRSVNRKIIEGTKLIFPSGVAIDDTLVGHIEFALRHEGVNLEVIDAAFEHIAAEDLVKRFEAAPNAEYIRRACFLWEWLANKPLSTLAQPTGRYVDMFPATEYVTAIEPRRASKFRVRDNALGTSDFCPTVLRASIPQNPGMAELLAEVGYILEAVTDREMYVRAVQYLYLSETRGNYAIERETPSAGKLDRFVQLLRKPGEPATVNEGWLVGLQNTVVRDVYSQEASYRGQQNWLEDSTGRITFFPPAPADLRGIMAGWEAFVNDTTRCQNVLVKAACAAFGFVYLHPFMDGNGRLHRFLIHHALARSGLLAKEAILPVSAVILKHIPEYYAVLTAFSRPVTALWDYKRGGNDPMIVRSPGSRAYRFFEADREVLFLYNMIRLAVKEELPREIAWLQGYDQAFMTLERELDLPQKDLAGLIRMAYSNQGTLSLNRRKQYAHLPESVLTRIETVVRQTFGMGL